jgi:4-diphosphocytidyl-2-C-methyl-D-erythritol kinase
VSIWSFRKTGNQSLLIKSPAKINLRLEVFARRPDGYHDIRTVMVPIDLSDILQITLREQDGIVLSSNRSDLPLDDRNLAYRAGALVLGALGKRQGCLIRIQKRIPVGAGLGGGSSNAAATLVGVNELLGGHLTDAELIAMAVELGADVSFFVFGRPALATGIGEKLEPFAGLPPLWFLLVYPGIHVSTQWAYERLNFWLTKPRDHINMPAFSWDISNLGRFLKNDLEKVVLEAYPVLSSVKERLMYVGAEGSLMSGSGSTVFGVFPARQKAKQAYDQLKGELKGGKWEVFLARSIGS